MENRSNVPYLRKKWIKIFRWYFYIASLQLLLYFVVPAVIFPGKVVIDIETISALTLGIFVCAFFLMVNIVGFFLDKSRRILYGFLLSILTVYFIWVIVTWSFIERMDYLLR